MKTTAAVPAYGARLTHHYLSGRGVAGSDGCGVLPVAVVELPVAMVARCVAMRAVADSSDGVLPVVVMTAMRCRLKSWCRCVIVDTTDFDAVRF